MAIELVKLEGSHFDIGVQHGRRLQSVIKKSVIPFVDDDMKTLQISQQAIEKTTKEYSDLIEKAYPEILDETRGIAEGAGIEYQKALLILLYWEVRDTVTHSFPECSSFVASGSATSEGQPVASQNTDWPIEMIERGVNFTFHVQPEERYSFIGRGLAGNLGRPSVIGFNEEGLTFVGSGIKQANAGFGFPPLTITRIGLEKCATVDEFIKLVRSIPKWSHAGENVDVLDKAGNIARISFTTDRIMFVQSKDHFLPSTNHYHNIEMSQFGLSTRKSYPSSYERYERLVELLQENYGKIDGTKAKEIMSDHKFGDSPPDGVKSLCRHGEKTQTLTNVVLLPEKNEFWISEGTPCRDVYSKFNL